MGKSWGIMGKSWGIMGKSWGIMGAFSGKFLKEFSENFEELLAHA